MSRATPDVTEERFGALTALRRSHANASGVYWDCRCDCGRTSTVRLQSLQRGQTKSCGCLRRSASQERMRKLALARAGAKRYAPSADVMGETFSTDTGSLLRRLGLAA